MGFRRLSIIDLEGGTQPIYNENRDMVITFNGEIYNHLELREDLIAKGHVMGSHADTEVLLHGYEEYGEDLLPKLRGMFAFVIWDSKTKTLFWRKRLFRLKPFYYSIQNGQPGLRLRNQEHSGIPRLQTGSKQRSTGKLSHIPVQRPAGNILQRRIQTASCSLLHF